MQKEKRRKELVACRLDEYKLSPKNCTTSWTKSRYKAKLLKGFSWDQPGVEGAVCD